MIAYMLVVMAAGVTMQAASPPVGSGGAICLAQAQYARNCSLTWDLSATPRTYYAVERLDAETGDWVRIRKKPFLTPYGTGVRVRAGHLYRVRGCDDEAFSSNCISSRSAWAPLIRPGKALPATVMITTPDGEQRPASISKEDPENEQNIQYNVYLMADLLGRASLAPLPPMTRPPEPGTHGDVAHEIHHNVYIAYEAIREYDGN